MLARYKFLRLSNGKIRSEAGDVEWQVGEWHEEEGAPILCDNGFHCSVKPYDALRYVHGEVIARVEVEGPSVVAEDKECWMRMRLVQIWRWEKKDSVRLAIFAAEQVLHFYEERHPGDVRPRKAIEAAKRYLDDPSAAYAAAYAAAAADAADAAAYAAARAEFLDEINAWIENHLAELCPI